VNAIGIILLLIFLFQLPTSTCLAYNLLSAGQLIENGYSVVFHDNYCIVHDKKTGQNFFGVQITKNKMFPFDVANENCVFVAQTSEVVEL